MHLNNNEYSIQLTTYDVALFAIKALRPAIGVQPRARKTKRTIKREIPAQKYHMRVTFSSSFLTKRGGNMMAMMKVMGDMVLRGGQIIMMMTMMIMMMMIMTRIFSLGKGGHCYVGVVIKYWQLAEAGK